MVYLVLDSAEPAPVLLQVIEEGNVGPDVVLPLRVLLPGDTWGCYVHVMLGYVQYVLCQVMCSTLC